MTPEDGRGTSDPGPGTPEIPETPRTPELGDSGDTRDSPSDHRRSSPPSARGPDEEPWRTAAPDEEEMDRAVEQLIDEVETEPEASPLLSLGGLRDRVAIVTGASSGIGKAAALELARCGVHIAFNYVDDGTGKIHKQATEVTRALRELEVRVFCRSCDIRDPRGVEEFVADASEELGGLHILVNNAGIHRDETLWSMTDEEWSEVLDTNLTGMFYMIRAVAPEMRAQEYGKIVNVASVYGMRAEFGLSNYSASKAGIIALTRTAAVELGPSNVNVNAVAPGYIRTPRLTENVSTEILDRARDKSALGRLGDPQDVANVILFLCSEGARHLAGAVIPVDAGYML